MEMVVHTVIYSRKTSLWRDGCMGWSGRNDARRVLWSGGEQPYEWG